MDITQVLQKTFVFRDLPLEEIQKLSAVLHRQGVSAGDFFFEEGEPSKTIYIVEEGTVQITKKSLTFPSHRFRKAGRRGSRPTVSK